MRYEIAVLLKSLEEYHSRIGSYHPVDTETIGAAIEKLRAAYRQNLPDLHEETFGGVDFCEQRNAYKKALCLQK